MQPKFNITQEQLHQLYIVENKSRKECAEFFGCSDPLIKQKIRKFKLQKPKHLENKNKERKIMDIKSMLVALAEQQAEKMKEEAMGHIASDEFSDMLATKMNEKINIPFVKEDKEQKFFEEMMDIVTDLLSGVFKGK